MTGVLANYDLILVDPPTYARALAETRRAEPPPHPIAVAIVTAMTTLATMMRDQETGCCVCGDDDAYVFAVSEPPPQILCCVPEGGDASASIAGPVCAACARLSDAEKAEKIRASMTRMFPGSRERKTH